VYPNLTSIPSAFHRSNALAYDFFPFLKRPLKIFRWQQLAIAVLAGIVIGGAGTWYFASLPLKEAAEYILLLKNAPASPQNATQSTPSAPHHIQHNQKPKSVEEPQPQVEAAPVTQQP
jgi:hypothetical protein